MSYFRYIIDHLAENGESRAQVSRRCGVSDSLVTKVYRGECGLSSSLVKQMVRVYGADPIALAKEIDTYNGLTAEEREALAEAWGRLQ